MRFDTKVYFTRVTKGEYNRETGNYGKPVEEKDMQLADVTDTGQQSMNILYGQIKKGSKVVRLPRHYDKPFDYIVIKKKKYKVDMERKLRVKHAFIVSEVQ